LHNIYMLTVCRHPELFIAATINGMSTCKKQKVNDITNF
jgi:hypothetical protein